MMTRVVIVIKDLLFYSFLIKKICEDLQGLWLDLRGSFTCFHLKIGCVLILQLENDVLLDLYLSSHKHRMWSVLISWY